MISRINSLSSSEEKSDLSDDFLMKPNSYGSDISNLVCTKDKTKFFTFIEKFRALNSTYATESKNCLP